MATKPKPRPTTAPRPAPARSTPAAGFTEPAAVFIQQQTDELADLYVEARRHVAHLQEVIKHYCDQLSPELASTVWYELMGDLIDNYPGA